MSPTKIANIPTINSANKGKTPSTISTEKVIGFEFILAIIAFSLVYMFRRLTMINSGYNNTCK